jgi:hexokinase
MEHVGGIHKIKNLGIDNEAQMAIYEWVCRCPHRHSMWRFSFPLFFYKGAFDFFGHKHLLRTKYDQIIDETSNKPSKQAFGVCPCHIAGHVVSL